MGRRSKYKLYYISLKGAYCGLSAHRTLTEAKRIALAENGTNNLDSVSLATEEQISSVKSMGGYVPDIDRLNHE